MTGIFRGYGLQGDALTTVVSAVTADRKRWLDFMMRFELGLDEPDPKRAPISAGTIAASCFVGGMIPLTPYILTSSISDAFAHSVGFAGVALLALGGIKGAFHRHQQGKIRRSDAAGGRACRRGRLCAGACHQLIS